MSAELMQWLIEASTVTAVAILLALALRPALARMFGIRAAILIWALVPLALFASILPARSIDAAPASDTRTVISLDGLGQVAAAAQAVGQSLPVTWRTGAFVAWLAGVALMLLVLAYRQNRFRRLLGALRPAGRRLLASDRSSAGPALLGVIRPRVIVPRDFERRFSPRQRRLMLAHEYTHLRRADPAWNLAAAGFRCLFWFNPLIHFAATRFRHDQELACDASVLARRRGARRAYAAALLAQQDDLPASAFGFGAHPLKERIRMLARLKRTSPKRHRLGSLMALTLALAMAAIAWAANPEAKSASAVAEEQFAFDIEVTVDGRSQTGDLILTGDAAISSGGGQPRMLASETLRLEHRDDESGWAAEVTISRMADDKFSVTSTIRKNEEVVATPRMIIGADSPASIETRDPDTGEVAYRLVLTPVDPVQTTPVVATNSNSATLLFTVNGALELDTRVELPPAPPDSMLISISRDGEPKPWDASVSLKRLDIERLELCLESFNLQGVTHSIMEKKGCMTFDEDIQTNAYMKGEFDDAGISWRLDMVPNVHELLDADKS